MALKERKRDKTEPAFNVEDMFDTYINNIKEYNELKALGVLSKTNFYGDPNMEILKPDIVIEKIISNNYYNLFTTLDIYNYYNSSSLTKKDIDDGLKFIETPNYVLYYTPSLVILNKSGRILIRHFRDVNDFIDSAALPFYYEDVIEGRVFEMPDQYFKRSYGSEYLSWSMDSIPTLADFQKFKKYYGSGFNFKMYGQLVKTAILKIYQNVKNNISMVL